MSRLSVNLLFKMLEIKTLEPFGRGNHRKVYRHPESQDLCVKVMSQDWRETAQRVRAPWYVKLLRPKWYFHENLAECRFAKGVEKRLGELAWNFMPRCHGFVETDLGEALVVDLILDHDGRISMSLSDYLWEFGMTEECEKALEDFWKGLKKYMIFARGRPDNVSVRQNEDGSLQIIAIDGFGVSQLIPLGRWISSEGQKRLEKWRKKQKRAIAEALELKKSGKRLFESKGKVIR